MVLNTFILLLYECILHHKADEGNISFFFLNINNILYWVKKTNVYRGVHQSHTSKNEENEGNRH